MSTRTAGDLGMTRKTSGASRVAFAALMAGLALLLALPLTLYNLQDMREVPLKGSGGASISSILIHTTILVGLIVSLISFRRFNPSYEVVKPINHTAAFFRCISRFGVMLAIVFVLVLFVLVLLSVAARFGLDPTFSDTAMFIITAVYALGLGFGLAFWTSGMNYQQLFWLTVISVVVGLAAAIALAPDGSWWTSVLSALGIGPSGWIFDLTFIVGGLLLLIVVDDKLDDLEILRADGAFESVHFRSYRIVLTVQCLAMIGVGVFPFTGITTIPHQIAATFAVFSFLLIAPAFIWLLPIYSLMTRVLATLPSMVGELMVAGYFGFGLSFALLELIYIGLIMIWVIIFYYATRAYILRVRPDLEND